MNKKQNRSLHASALRITFVSLWAVLLTLAGAVAKNQFEQKPAAAGMALQNAQRDAAASESSAAEKRVESGARRIFGENRPAISTLKLLLRKPYNSWLYGPTPVTPALLRLDPTWDPLRGDPGFEEIVASLAPKDVESKAK